VLAPMQTKNPSGRLFIVPNGRSKKRHLNSSSVALGCQKKRRDQEGRAQRLEALGSGLALPRAFIFYFAVPCGTERPVWWGCSQPQTGPRIGRNIQTLSHACEAVKEKAPRRKVFNSTGG
jgi:hypothetical protein